ncbi:MAG: Na(+)/H(+) antiporter subunit B [Ramlibacter sp.]
MRGDLVLRVFVKLLIPFMLVFALYVQFHGELGPGGGFQAGVVVAAAIIFYALIFGLPAVRKVVPDALVESMVALGVLIYAGVGVAGLMMGGNFLDYFVLAHDPVHGQERGIFWVEVGVATTVSAVMLKIFYMFAGRGRDPEDA